MDSKKLNRALGMYYHDAMENSAYDELPCRPDDEERISPPEQFAEGGMKRILKQTDRMVERDVARAVLKNALDDPLKQKRFLNEACLTARLEHPNIMPVYDIGIEEGGFPYFTMKMVKGRTLTEFIQQQAKMGTFLASEGLSIFLKVCDAIAFTHSNNVIHLDLKPDNIRVGDFSEVIVCDWGLACDQSSSCKQSVISGTPGFMSPEQAKGEGTFTIQSDIYSLGALLCFILTGNSPVEGKTPQEVMDNTIAGRLKDIDGIPLALKAVILRALNLVPDARYQNVQELEADVKAYLNGFATQAENATFLTHLHLLFKRHTALSAVLGFSFTLITALTFWFVQGLQHSEKDAVKSEKAAMKAQQEAVAEKIAKEELSRLAAPEFVKKASEEIRAYHFDAAYHNLRTALQLDDSLGIAYLLKGQLLIGRLKFTEALEALKKAQGKCLDDFISLAMRFEHKEMNQKNLLEFVSLTAKIPWRKITLGQFFYGNGKRLSQIPLKTLLLAVSEKMSPMQVFHDGNQLKVSYESFSNFSPLINSKISDLDLSGTAVRDLTAAKFLKLERLNIARTPISGLSSLRKQKLVELDLSHTGVFEIKDILYLPIEKLKISGIRLRFPNHLLRLKTLKYLKIDKGILPLHTERSLRHRKVVIEFTD